MIDRTKLKIATPCSEDFEEMHGEGHRRFCDHCEKHVHNISELTREEAIALIKDNVETGLCVVYRFDANDQVRFREQSKPQPPRPSRSQLRGVKRLLAAAAMVPLLAALPACDTPTQEPEVVVDSEHTPCGYATERESFRPIDLIMEAEERFLEEIRSFLDEPDYDYEMVAGGLAPPEPEFYDPYEPIEEPPVQELVEPAPVETEMIMGDLAMEPGDLEQLHVEIE